MSETWRERLELLLDDRGKSMRAASLAAGVGQNYIHGVLKDGKEPTLDRLLAICQALDVSVIWLLLGVEITPRRETILRLLEENPQVEELTLQILQEMVRR